MNEQYGVYEGHETRYRVSPKAMIELRGIGPEEKKGK